MDKTPLTVEAWENGLAEPGWKAIESLCKFYEADRAELVLIDLEKIGLVNPMSATSVSQKPDVLG